MNKHEVAEIVGRVAHEVANEPLITEVTFPMDVYNRVREEHPEVIAHIKRYHPRNDPYQMMKVYIPNVRGWIVT